MRPRELNAEGVPLEGVQLGFVGPACPRQEASR